MTPIMNFKSYLPTALIAFACSIALPAFAQSRPSQAAADKADKPAAPQVDPAIVAKARASYPLKTCIVSDEKLGDMGEAFAYVHREAGKPDRVVFFCCDGCVDDFKADPAKFLKKLDAAAATKKGGQKKGNADGAAKEQ